MATFVIMQKLDQNEADSLKTQVRRWFAAHPKRRVCRVDCGAMWKFTRKNIDRVVDSHTKGK